MHKTVEGTKAGNDWHADGVVDGIRDVHCKSWLGFVDFLNGSLSEYDKYVYRGQASSEWKLKSSLERIAPAYRAPRKGIDLIKSHLDGFKRAAKGIRYYPINMSDDDWWALGQHNGFATPLLDWTEAPYIAAFFAFEGNPEMMADECVIYALPSSIGYCDSRTKVKWDGLRLFKSNPDENRRMVSQRGLFSIASFLYSCVEEYFKEKVVGNGEAALLRIFIPKTERDTALRNLNKMNINHLSLFPDLYGASKYSNFQLTIDKY
ncbi:FRG domain-containing protein [Chromatiaceae bacterium AAb-1]|nr:FRG domain-containing protein [Chromatiaceae bacterium AAb-1]